MIVLDMTLNYLMVRLQFWGYGECGLPLHFHYSKVHSDWSGNNYYGPIYGSNHLLYLKLFTMCKILLILNWIIGIR